LRLIETSDLSAIHNLHSLVETDEFNTLGIPEDSNETRGIIESWITSNKEKKIKSYTFVIEDINTSPIHWFVYNLETKASKWRSLVQVTFRSLGKRAWNRSS
jgi:hypothetical protein